MGGIADYSGSLVLQLPLAEATYALVQARRDGQVVVVSGATTDLTGPNMVEMPIAEIYRYVANTTALRQMLTANPDTAWASYVLGVVAIVARQANIYLYDGITIVIDSQVPLGKGVSSSAAIEVATMRAMLALVGHQIDGRTLAIWSQMVENHIVGVKLWNGLKQTTRANPSARRLTYGNPGVTGAGALGPTHGWSLSNTYTP